MFQSMEGPKERSKVCLDGTIKKKLLQGWQAQHWGPLLSYILVLTQCPILEEVREPNAKQLHNNKLR